MKHDGDHFMTLEEQTYRRLLESILVGEYPPGTKLAGSRLADEMRVSRITVANALKRLTSEGFVVSQPHREAVVAMLDEADLHEIFLMRHALEDVVLREAARQITPEMLHDLREIDRQVRQSIRENDVRAYRAHERDFHLAIYAASGLRLVATMLMDLWTRLEPYRGRRHSEFGLLVDSLPDRESIIAALEHGDGRRAALAMRRHVDRGHKRMIEVLQRNTATAGTSGVERARKPVVAVMPAPAGSLVAAMQVLPDARRPQGRMFPMAPALALAVLAMLCGETRASGIARWGQMCHPAIRETLGLTTPEGPSGPTMHRLLGQVDTGQLVDCVQEWLLSHQLETGDTGGYLPGFAAIGQTGAMIRRELETGSSERWQRLPALALAGFAAPQSSQVRLAIAELRLALRGRAG